MIEIINYNFIKFLEHINYVKDKIGVDHVGIGGDFDGIELLVLIKCWYIEYKYLKIFLDYLDLLMIWRMYPSIRIYLLFY